jgi:hypothetical protein
VPVCDWRGAHGSAQERTGAAALSVPLWVKQTKRRRPHGPRLSSQPRASISAAAAWRLTLRERAMGVS